MCNKQTNIGSRDCWHIYHKTRNKMQYGGKTDPKRKQTDSGHRIYVSKKKNRLDHKTPTLNSQQHC